ncbi:MAG: glycosyltransferase family 39 protein [Chloroflexota bacterium]
MNQPSKRQTILISLGLFVLAFIVRSINLGQFLTTDEPRGWLGWSIEFMQALMTGQLQETYQHYSPGVTLMWSGGIGLWLNYLFSNGSASSFAEFLQALPFDPIDPQVIYWFRLPNTFVGAASVGLAYPFAKKLLGPAVALIGCLLLLFDPLSIGMNRILGHDGLATAFMTISALAALVFFIYRDESRYTPLIVSAIAAGLAFLAKSTALFLLPYVGLIVLVTWLFHRKKLNLLLKDFTMWLLLTALTFILFWPALWVQPIQTIQAMIEGLQGAASEPHNRGSFFAGQPVPDPGVTFYWIAAYFRLTAITTLGVLLAISALFFLPKASRQQDEANSDLRSVSQAMANFNVSQIRVALLLLFAFVLFYLMFLSFGSKKQDRYIVPILPMASFVAAFGYVWITAYTKKHMWQLTLLALIILLQMGAVWRGYPHYLSHYNFLAGGTAQADDTLLVGWGEGLELAAAYLNNQPQADTIKASSWYHSAFEPYFKGEAIEKGGGEKISRSAKPALVADYAILYVNQIQRYMPTPGFIQYFQTMDPAHIVEVNGISYAYIYPAPSLQHAFDGEVRLVGQAELLGYQILNEEKSVITAIPSNSAALVQIYWEWQGKAEGDLLGLSLVDQEGRVWGWGNRLETQASLPFAQWQEGMIVYDEFALVVFPGTPPGTYTLKAWVDRPATGEIVGFFPINTDDVQITVSRPPSPPPISDLELTETYTTKATKDITLLGSQKISSMPNPMPLGQRHDFILFWQAEKNGAKSEDVALDLVDETGVQQATWVGIPAAGRFPTDHWQAGDIIRDPWSLTLPPYVPPGNYTLKVTVGQQEHIPLTEIKVEGRPRNFAKPKLDIDLNTEFTDGIVLLGLQASVEEANIVTDVEAPLTISLVWQGQQRIENDYTITMQILNANNQVLAQRDAQPLEGAAPTTSWTIGEIITDQTTLMTPADLGPAPHRLLIALYRPETGERLLLSDGADHVAVPVSLR